MGSVRAERIRDFFFCEGLGVLPLWTLVLGIGLRELRVQGKALRFLEAFRLNLAVCEFWGLLWDLVCRASRATTPP